MLSEGGPADILLKIGFNRAHSAGRNDKSERRGVCLVCRVYVWLWDMPGEGMRLKQSEGSADEILTHSS